MRIIARTWSNNDGYGLLLPLAALLTCGASVIFLEREEGVIMCEWDVETRGWWVVFMGEGEMEDANAVVRVVP